MNTFFRLYLSFLCFFPLAAHSYLVSTTSAGDEIKCAGNSVSYWINSSGAPAGASSAIQLAMNTWSTVSGADFQFLYVGVTSQSGYAYDYQNICSFQNLDSGGTIAVNHFWYDLGNGNLLESDITFNTVYTWSASGEAGKMDVQNIATHELGHSLSLDDLYDSGDTEKTMYGWASEGQTNKQSLDADDIAGIIHLYPSLSPTVALSVNNSSIAEASGVATVTATLSEIHTQSVTVNLAFSGTATLNTDYTPSATSIVIPAGSTSRTMTLTAMQDSLDEDNETIIVDISSVVNATESGMQQQTVSITDDDPAPTVTLSLSNASISEAGGAATVRATLSSLSSKTVTVNLAFSGTATRTNDYTAASSIAIPAGSTINSITLKAVQDTLYEGDETLIVDISSELNGTESGTQRVTVTITDDDPAMSVAPTGGAGF
ncbi:MAG: Calx-beta domain-containing protein, partial [Kiritimatiellales bacterium]|nr:Calx-beta domain-containing protein [Kiritimatiellales bacterium]